MKREMPPVHPGQVLLEDFLKPMNLTQYRLAKFIQGSSASAIERQIVSSQ